MTRRRRAFVVDDDPTTQLLLGDLAGELGWQTERFATLAALRHALARDEPDLLILDDALPDGSGGDFVAEMRSQDRLRRLPVVICTGAARLAVVSSAGWRRCWRSHSTSSRSSESSLT